MVKAYDKKLVLADGTEYYGYGFGGDGEAVAELVFDTAMIGYQEIISDPAYSGKMVVMTYPLIGNYGIADEDIGGKLPPIGGLVVREYNDSPSNFRYTKTLDEIMEENHIPGIYGLDTRKLTRFIRDNGTCKALITAADTPKEDALARLAAELPADMVAKVSCKKRWYSRTPNHRFHVVVVDCGVKKDTVRALNAIGCNVTVVPWNTAAADVIAMKPDGVYLSEGPGDPKAVPQVQELVKALRGQVPLFGVGLGCQVIALAYGADTEKLKFGHHGGNHPVRILATGKVDIVAQNHDYAIKADSVDSTVLTVTRINLMDNTVEGVEDAANRVCGVQYQPEGVPESLDSIGLWKQFICWMKGEDLRA